MNQKLPRHHLPQELLLEYAAGTALPTTSLLVACHLTLCPQCRQHVAQIEEVGATLLEQQPEASLAEDAVARALAAIEGPVSTVSEGTRGDFKQSAVIPLPLVNALEERRLKLQWSLPGVRSATLKLAVDLPPARLVHFQPGIRIPSHGHGAPEFVLILEGMLKEDDQQYRRGDVAFSDTGKVHKQVIGAEEACLALIVNEGSLTPNTTWGKLLKRIMGL